MKNIIILLIFGVNSVFGQVDSITSVKIDKLIGQVDSITTVKIDKLINKVDKLEGQILISKKNSELLNKELLFFKVKEDYYATALSDQGTRFSLIIAGILGLFALLTFGGFKYQIFLMQKKVDKKLLKHNVLIKNYKKMVINTEIRMQETRGNLNVALGTMLRKRNEFCEAFVLYLRAANDRDMRNTGKEVGCTVLLRNLKTAFAELNKVTINDKKKALIDNKLLIDKCLVSLSGYPDEEVKSLSAKVKVKYDELLATMPERED